MSRSDKGIWRVQLTWHARKQAQTILSAWRMCKCLVKSHPCMYASVEQCCNGEAAGCVHNDRQYITMPILSRIGTSHHGQEGCILWLQMLSTHGAAPRQQTPGKNRLSAASSGCYASWCRGKHRSLIPRQALAAPSLAHHGLMNCVCKFLTGCAG